jgi:hypothetical protein
MKRSSPATDPQRLASKIQLARIRIAQAESSLASAREQAREAKRRRKAAKQAARRAKKKVKQAKADLQEAKQVLLTAEEELALTLQPAVPGAEQPGAIPRDFETPPAITASLPESLAPTSETAS